MKGQAKSFFYTGTWIKCSDWKWNEIYTVISERIHTLYIHFTLSGTRESATVWMWMCGAAVHTYQAHHSKLILRHASTGGWLYDKAKGPFTNYVIHFLLIFNWGVQNLTIFVWLLHSKIHFVIILLDPPSLDDVNCERSPRIHARLTDHLIPWQSPPVGRSRTGPLRLSGRTSRLNIHSAVLWQNNYFFKIAEKYFFS